MDEVLYFKPRQKPDIWQWLMWFCFLISGVCLVFLGLDGFIENGDPKLIAFQFLAGLAFLVFFITYCLNESGSFLNQYVVLMDDKLVIKRNPFEKPEIFPWRQIERVDMKSFEPVFYIKGCRPLRLTMEHNQTKILRERLVDAANQQKIRLER